MVNEIKTAQAAIEKEKDKCVVCGAETKYGPNIPISEREFYVEGAGQLCQKCYYDLYIKKNR